MSDLLNERVFYHLSTTGKLFIAGVAAWIIGNQTRLKVKGTRAEIDNLAAALVASKRFQSELLKPGATADSVIAKLGLKNASIKDFERLTGIPLP